MEEKMARIEIACILGYWDKFSSLKETISNLNIKLCKLTLDDLSDYIKNGNRVNQDANVDLKESIKTMKTDIFLRLEFYQNEYVKYLDKLGIKLNDHTQSEKLYNLVNNGVVI